MKHRCIKLPMEFQIRTFKGNDDLWLLDVTSGNTANGIEYCPYCGDRLSLHLAQRVGTITRMTNEEVYKNYGVTLLRDDGDNENYALKSATSILSGFLDISEESAEYLVKTLVDAVKHELTAKEAQNEQT